MGQHLLYGDLLDGFAAKGSWAIGTAHGGCNSCGEGGPWEKLVVLSGSRDEGG